MIATPTDEEDKKTTAFGLTFSLRTAKITDANVVASRQARHSHVNLGLTQHLDAT